MENLDEKLDALKRELKSLGSVAIAFSGGVDSTFLLQIASDVLKERCVAIIAQMHSFPNREFLEAKTFCECRGITFVPLKIDCMKLPEFVRNEKNRCYICKKNLFEKILLIARELSLDYVCEGSNLDDLGDYRPGLLALKELNIQSPLRTLGFRKEEIRALSKKLNLPTAGKKSLACLASRVPYGEKITEQKLSMVDVAEEFLFSLGIKQGRVRIHEGVHFIARIEVPQEFFQTIFTNREAIYAKCRELGFTYVSLDLLGYRTGSMNEALPEKFTKKI